MAQPGAQAQATTPSGYGVTLGLTDGRQITRDIALQHAASICASVDVPVNRDFENGFGDDPETVKLAAEAGLSGVSVKDTAVPGTNSNPFDPALARIEAAGIVLTARADGWLMNSYELAEALRRCHAFAQAGADVMYAPLVDAGTTRALAATGTPVNLLAAGAMRDLTTDEIGALGPARISIGVGWPASPSRCPGWHQCDAGTGRFHDPEGGGKHGRD
ncbi:isocitrate lyase/phosphoenolpyruvate mutase family protein [Leisingera aquimarina]|uniref:isocitrate lyase/phosphoenolpyruvate mutase family protein n=1 Tax=Leisingera aquimarina TaxID=476529 RepID=UPI0003FD3ACB|nr:isocitrate lyase/phosphoenolpyruvate mutase family protein [Leisingera aquimarina]